MRQVRNRFVHAVENAYPIDPQTNMSELFAMVSVGNCRRLLSQLRLAVRYVLEQIPELTNTVQLAENVRWLGDDEVP